MGYIALGKNFVFQILRHYKNYIFEIFNILKMIIFFILFNTYFTSVVPTALLLQCNWPITGIRRVL